MQAGSYDLRWYSAAEGGKVMQLLGTNGSLTVLKAANFSAGATVTGAGQRPAFTALPVANDGAAEIYFGRKTNGTSVNPGDVWVAGHAGFGAGAGNFGVGATSLGLITRIDGTTGLTTFNYPVNVSSTLTVGNQPCRHEALDRRPLRRHHRR
jgi:hypothetical protein